MKTKKGERFQRGLQVQDVNIILETETWKKRRTQRTTGQRTYRLRARQLQKKRSVRRQDEPA